MKKTNYISLGLAVAFVAFISLGAVYSFRNTANKIIVDTAQVKTQTVSVGNNSAAWLFESIFQTVLQNL